MWQGINGTTQPGACDSPAVSDKHSRTFFWVTWCHSKRKCIYLKFMLQAIRFFMSSNLTVQGLKVKNSPQFHFRFDVCQNVHIEMLNIKAPAGSPNTDGIHIENTNNVKIYNSAVSNGDSFFYTLKLFIFVCPFPTSEAHYLFGYQPSL